MPIEHDEQCRGFLVDLAREAGSEIMRVYRTGFAVERKADDSPLTEADRRAHALIVARLAERFPGVPVLSEEGAATPYAERRGWRGFFLVDPLDGTKEFVKRSGEFTVNIAWVEERRPRFGVLAVPDRGLVYHGGPGLGAFREAEGGAPEPIRTRPALCGVGERVLASVSHPSPELEVWLTRVPVAERIEAGSALKFCLLAEGRATLYPRLNLTYEWDTAAGHALVLGAGGSFTGLDGGEFLYNKRDLRNPGFIARA